VSRHWYPAGRRPGQLLSGWPQRRRWPDGALYFIGKPNPQLKGVDLAHAPSAVKPKPKEVSAYKVAPDLPKYISIPAIHVDSARVIGLGLKDNQIASPANIYDAGWYQNSAKPGQAGAMFIFGHVSSWQANGVFHDLKKLKPGDKIAVTKGDNTVFNYKVVSQKVYDADNVDMNEVLAPVNPAKPGLNLLTCAGKVIKGTSNFSERLVVFSEQI
jgi:LPXTG-site transpeptidase (sortase) family protein